MGTWGAGPFDSDGAGDLVASIRHGDFTFAGVEPYFEDDEYVEADGGQAALALVELTLAVHGAPHAPVLDEETAVPAFAAHLTPERTTWLLEQSDRVLSDPETSELYELWAETGEDEWLATARASVERLRALTAG